MPKSKTVIGPVVREAIRKQRYARMARDRVGFFRGISDASEHTDSLERLAALEFFSDRPRAIVHKEILGNSDRVSKRDTTHGRRDLARVSLLP
jgi:hypothetical protein